MTSRGPQRREQVEVQDAAGDRVATATCFLAAWDDGGERRWRGFLADIDPAGALTAGRYEIVLASGARAGIEVHEVRPDPREQAIFRGLGAPPPDDGEEVRRAAHSD